MKIFEKITGKMAWFLRKMMQFGEKIDLHACDTIFGEKKRNEQKA